MCVCVCVCIRVRKKMKSRISYPPTVRFSNFDWHTEEPDYEPINYTHDDILSWGAEGVASGITHPCVPNSAFKRKLRQVETFCAPLFIGPDRMPRNPNGRTGITGRGIFPYYGPNYMAAPIMTRIKDGKPEFLGIMRKDDGMIAIPAGQVKAKEGKVCEKVSDTLIQDMYREAQKQEAPIRMRMFDIFQTDGAVVYEGYSHDKRNTDISWFEVTCRHFHISDYKFGLLMKFAGDDEAILSRWLPLDRDTIRKTHEPHRVYLEKVMAKFSHA